MLNEKKLEVALQKFKDGVKSQLKQEWTIGVAVFVGLTQGLKYGGSFKRGLTDGLTTLAVIAVTNGVFAVMSSKDKQEIPREE